MQASEILWVAISSIETVMHSVAEAMQLKQNSTVA